MELNARQKRVAYATDSHILCLAGPGSGKTRALTERVRHLIVDVQVPPEKIVCITFTNLAAREMKSRLGDISDGMFIGTIHSYANFICKYNNVDMTDAIQDEDYDDLLITGSRMKKFPEVEHLLVDEAQDIAQLEYVFITKIPAKNIFYVADDRQNIYSFRGGSDRYISMMNKDINFKKYYLTENYRSSPNIIEFANDLLETYKPMGMPCQPIKTKDGIVEQGVSVGEALDMLEESHNWGSWFILARTNKECEKAMEMLDERGIPNVTFKKADLDSNEVLEKIMDSNNVKVLTIHQAKGLERRNVIVIGARTYNIDERKIAYVAATRAENALYWCPSIAKGRAKRKSKWERGTDERNQLINF